MLPGSTGRHGSAQAALPPRSDGDEARLPIVDGRHWRNWKRRMI
jgi:hypothetical protein